MNIKALLMIGGMMMVVPSILLYHLIAEKIQALSKWLKYTVYPTKAHPEYYLYAPILIDKFHYYHLLEDHEQHAFIARLTYIRSSKKFNGRGIEITEEMEILVSAAIAQLTFGLSEFDIQHFNEINIAPESFYSELIGADVKGLTFRHGIVIMSWADFVEGYLVANDKLNLGLHELAHALSLDYSAQLEIEHDMEDWAHTGIKELQKLRTNTDSQFMRAYAGTDMHELWACCVECFFEAPIEFEQHIPELYHKVARVLNQDMAKRMRQRQQAPNLLGISS